MIGYRYGEKGGEGEEEEEGIGLVVPRRFPEASLASDLAKYMMVLVDIFLLDPS